MANSLTFSTTGYTLSGGAITLAAPTGSPNVTVNGTGTTATINATGNLTNFETISVATGDTLFLSSTNTATNSNANFLSVDATIPAGDTGGDGALFGGGTVDLTAGTFTVSGGPSGNISNGSSTTGGLVLGGTSTLVSPSGFEIGRGASGLLTVGGGTFSDTSQLTIGRSELTGQSAALVINSGTVTDTQNNTQSVAVFVGRGDGAVTSGTLTVNGGSLTVTNIVDVNENSVSGSSALNINGGTTSLGAIVFNGSDTNAASGGVVSSPLAGFTGGTGTLNVTGGTLFLGDAGTIASNVQGQGIVNLNTAGAQTGASVNLTGGTTNGGLNGTATSGGTVGALANWSSSVNMTLANTLGTTAGNVTFETDNGSGTAANITLSGVLSGTGGLNETSAGSGILNLSSATGNSYSGNTVVTSGILNVTNTSGSGTGTGSVTVNGGRLGGSGIITASTITTGAAVTINSGGILAPSAAVTNGETHLTLALQTGANLTLAAPALSSTPQLVFDLGANTAGSDEVLVTGGGLALNGQQFGNFTFNAETGIQAGTYVLIDDSGGSGITGALGTTQTGLVDGGLFNGTLTISGNDLDLTLTTAAVPEPATWALLLAGLGWLLFTLHRRRAVEARN